MFKHPMNTPSHSRPQLQQREGSFYWVSVTLLLLALGFTGCTETSSSEDTQGEETHLEDTSSDSAKDSELQEDIEKELEEVELVLDVDHEPIVGEGSPWEGELKVTLLREVAPNGELPGYELLQLEVEGASPAYAQWVAPPEGERRPAVMLTRPYTAIDWALDDENQRWVARGSGVFPDDSEPNYTEDSSDIPFYVVPPDDLAEESKLYGMHNTGVLYVFGRFYLGGDVHNDLEDMVLGLRFLAENALVDHERIGIMGTSWGGFESLYAAAYPPEGGRPLVGVAFSPLVDFEIEYQWMKSLPSRFSDPERNEEARAFFEPYLRRIDAAFPPALADPFEGFTYEALRARLSTPFLVVHDDWDLLVPFESSALLVGENDPGFMALWFEHLSPLVVDELDFDHGPFQEEAAGCPIMYSIAWAYLFSDLLGSDEVIILPADVLPFQTFLASIRVLQEGGHEVDYLAQGLLEIVDPRAQVFVLESGDFLPGSEFLTPLINETWGTSFSPEEIAQTLSEGLPEL